MREIPDRYCGRALAHVASMQDDILRLPRVTSVLINAQINLATRVGDCLARNTRYIYKDDIVNDVNVFGL